MKLLSLFVERESLIHQIDPITKLYYIVFAILMPAICSSITVSIACAFVSIILLAIGKVLKNTLSVFGFVSFVLFTVIIIQGLFGVKNETIFFQIMGLTFYKEGLMESLVIVFRVINIVASFLILVLTTRPSDLVEDLVRKGLSPRIGYVILSVFQIIPQMMSTVDTITDAQKSRGMETEGNLFVRMKAFVPLMGPVVLSSFNNAKERAMALEVRAFGSKIKRTFLSEPKNYKFCMPIRASLLIILIGAVIGRFIL